MAAIFVRDDNYKEQAETRLKFREEVYERLWIIPNWNIVQQSSSSLTAQSVDLITGKSARVKAKWKFGLKSFKGRSASNFCVYWKLTEAKGFPNEEVQVTAISTLLTGDSSNGSTDTWNGVVNLGQMVKGTHTFIFNSDKWGPWMNPNGELAYKLKLKVMEPDFEEFETQLFHKASVAQVRANFSSLLGDEATADLKIITSDGKELWAHKLILKVQCPVFESMFRSEMSDNRTGIVNIKDVNAKTLGILLHLFYTGQLLPSWKDQDTVVEFTYAVGKYQLHNVLKLLDDVLGSQNEENTCHKNIQLLNLARKLHLKTAEGKLLAKIKEALNKVRSSNEFFELYGNDKE